MLKCDFNCLITLIADEAVTTHSYEDELIQTVYFLISTTVMKTQVAVQLTSLLELGMLYSTCIIFHLGIFGTVPTLHHLI